MWGQLFRLIGKKTKSFVMSWGFLQLIIPLPAASCLARTYPSAGLFLTEWSANSGLLWFLSPTHELWPPLDWAVQISCLCTEKLEMQWGQSFPQLKLWGDFGQERGYYWSWSCNLTVTTVLTSRIQCYGSFNNSQVWKLKPLNGKNPVVQDHNYGVFLPEKQSYVT